MEQVSLRPLFDASVRQGALMGVLLSGVSVCMLLCVRVEALAVAFPVLCMTVPVLLLYTMRQVAAVNTAYCRFAPLWMSGIVQFISGGLICCLATVVTLRIMGAGYLREYIVAVFEQATGRQGVSMDGVVVPSAFDYANSLFWLVSFTGSMLSLVYAAVLPRVEFFTKSVVRRRGAFRVNEYK